MLRRLPAFARLVLAGYNQERITSSRLSDYLEVSLKYVPKIEGMLWAQPQGA